MPLIAERVDALARVLLQPLHRCRIQVQQVCKLCEIDTFGAGQLFVSAEHGERQHVQRCALRLVGHSRDDLGERPPLIQLALNDVADAGAASLLERELPNPLPLKDVVAGITYTEDRATLYVLAYTILRADEQITGAERIYLAQLANLLGLEPSLVQALEKDTGERIDALGDQGQLGG